MKILTSVYSPDAGEILYKGAPSGAEKIPGMLIVRGLASSFRKFNLCPNLSAMEKYFFRQRTDLERHGLFSYRKTREEARKFFHRLKFDIDPDIEVRKLGVAEQQMIEIAKSPVYDTQLLIMDEPTSSLSLSEVENLLILSEI